MSMPIARNAALAIGAILLADFLLTFNDALFKTAQVSLGLAAVFWLRAMVAVPLLLAVLMILKAPLIPKAPTLVFFRSLLLLMSWACLYWSFLFLPVANAVATAYINPIIIAVGTILLDRQALPSRVWGAIILGLSGSLMIVQPGVSTATWAYVLPVVAACTYSVAMLITGRHLQTENPQTVSLWLNLAFMLGGLGGLLFIGTSPILLIGEVFGANPWPFATMGVVIAVAGTAVAYAFQNGHAPMIATFDYSYVLFSIFWAFTFFGEVPNQLAVLGIGFVIGAGVLVLWRRS